MTPPKLDGPTLDAVMEKVDRALTEAREHLPMEREEAVFFRGGEAALTRLRRSLVRLRGRGTELGPSCRCRNHFVCKCDR